MKLSQLCIYPGMWPCRQRCWMPCAQRPWLLARLAASLRSASFAFFAIDVKMQLPTQLKAAHSLPQFLPSPTATCRDCKGYRSHVLSLPTSQGAANDEVLQKSHVMMPACPGALTLVGYTSPGSLAGHLWLWGPSDLPISLQPCSAIESCKLDPQSRSHD